MGNSTLIVACKIPDIKIISRCFDFLQQAIVLITQFLVWRWIWKTIIFVEDFAICSRHSGEEGIYLTKVTIENLIVLRTCVFTTRNLCWQFLPMPKYICMHFLFGRMVVTKSTFWKRLLRKRVTNVWFVQYLTIYWVHILVARHTHTHKKIFSLSVALRQKRDRDAVHYVPSTPIVFQRLQYRFMEQALYFDVVLQQKISRSNTSKGLVSSFTLLHRANLERWLIKYRKGVKLNVLYSAKKFELCPLILLHTSDVSASAIAIATQKNLVWSEKNVIASASARKRKILFFLCLSYACDCACVRNLLVWSDKT